LLRSKSEHHPRYEEADEEVEEEYHDLGARHGFEDHYLSEDVIAHLANVSSAFVTMVTSGQSGGQCTLGPPPLYI
jgi:hypothetical protein